MKGNFAPKNSDGKIASKNDFVRLSSQNITPQNTLS